MDGQFPPQCSRGFLPCLLEKLLHLQRLDIRNSVIQSSLRVIVESTFSKPEAKCNREALHHLFREVRIELHLAGQLSDLAILQLFDAIVCDIELGAYNCVSEGSLQRHGGTYPWPPPQVEETHSTSLGHR